MREDDNGWHKDTMTLVLQTIYHCKHCTSLNGEECLWCNDVTVCPKCGKVDGLLPATFTWKEDICAGEHFSYPIEIVKYGRC